MKILAACITICLFACMPSAYANNGEQSLAAGINALNHYHTDRAIRLFTMALLSNQLSKDDQVTALLDRGNAWSIKIDYARALKDCKAAARIEPDSAMVHAYLGKVYALEGDLDNAAAEYRKSQRIDPSYFKAYVGMCRIGYYQGKYDEALQNCDMALKLNPNSTYGHLMRGDVLSAQGKYREAIKAFNKSILSNMDNLVPYYHRGFTLFYYGEFKQAAQDFARAEPGNRRNLYISIWRYMAQARAGNRHAAANLWNTQQKARKLFGDKQITSNWPFDAILMFTGKMKPAKVLKNVFKTQYQESYHMEFLCESAYFVGEWYMIHQQPAKAKGMFLKATQYCPVVHNNDYDGATEYDGAIAELTRMHASPAKDELE